MTQDDTPSPLVGEGWGGGTLPEEPLLQPDPPATDPTPASAPQPAEAEPGATEPAEAEPAASEPATPEPAAPEPLAPEPDEDSLRLAEALVFASAGPVSARALSQLLPEAADADAVIAALRARYAGRGVELVEAGGGVQFRTAPDLAPRLRKVVEDAAPAAARRHGDAGDHRLSPAGDPRRRSRKSAAPACRSRRWTRCWRAGLIAPKGRRESPGPPDAVGHHAAIPGSVRAEGPARPAAARGPAAGAAATLRRVGRAPLDVGPLAAAGGKRTSRARRRARRGAAPGWRSAFAGVTDGLHAARQFAPSPSSCLSRPREREHGSRMFDFAWSEIGLIAAVALILIGPKDMPVAIRTITDMIKKARRMASEFQTHVDEMMREADLHEVRDQINEIRNFDIRGEIERTSIPTARCATRSPSNPLDPRRRRHAIAAAGPDRRDRRRGTGTRCRWPAPRRPRRSCAPAAPAFVPPGVVPPRRRRRRRTGGAGFHSPADRAATRLAPAGVPDDRAD